MPTVLVVDDDRDMRELQRAAFCYAGYRVVTATNGREALLALAQARPCLILLDLMMPVMDGLTFLDERRRLEVATEVPVVCLSAGGSVLLDAARRRGAVDCIEKPPDFDMLVALASRHCPGP